MCDNIKQLNRYETGTAGGKEKENEEEKGFEKQIMKNFPKLMGDKSPKSPKLFDLAKLKFYTR